MKKIKLTLNKDCCIDCGSCIPESHDYDSNTTYIDDVGGDGVHIANATPLSDGIEEIVLEVNDTQLERLRDAAGVCPVEAILVEDLD